MADSMYVNCYSSVEYATQIKTICEKQYTDYVFEISLDTDTSKYYNMHVSSRKPLYSVEFGKVWAFVDGIEAGMVLAAKIRNKKEMALTS